MKKGQEEGGETDGANIQKSLINRKEKIKNDKK